MNVYRVSVYASITVNAESEEQALALASDAILYGQIRMREFEFEVQESGYPLTEPATAGIWEH